MNTPPAWRIWKTISLMRQIELLGAFRLKNWSFCIFYEPPSTILYIIKLLQTCVGVCRFCWWEKQSTTLHTFIFSWITFNSQIIVHDTIELYIVLITIKNIKYFTMAAAMKFGLLFQGMICATVQNTVRSEFNVYK